MTGWEFKAVALPAGVMGQHWPEVVQLGREGWQLVTVVPLGAQVEVLMQRPIIPRAALPPMETK